LDNDPDGKYMKNGVGVEDPEILDTGKSIPVEERIHMPAGFDHRTGVRTAQETDMNSGKKFLQKSGQG
jgi:hypothetical protein